MSNRGLFTKKFRLVMLLVMCGVLLTMTACLEVKQKVSINRDGSGTAFLEVSVLKEYAPMIVPKMKQDIPKGWTLAEEKEKEGNHVLLLKFDFKNISDLSDDEMKFTFSSSKKGLFKEAYSFKMKQIKNSDAPFPYEFSLKVPGNVDTTNGNKLSSNEVKWNLMGFKRGTELVVESSAFSTPMMGGAGLIGFLILTGLGFVVVKSIKKKTPVKLMPASGKFCAECGAANEPDAGFCATCGKRIKL